MNIHVRDMGSSFKFSYYYMAIISLHLCCRIFLSLYCLFQSFLLWPVHTNFLHNFPHVWWYVHFKLTTSWVVIWSSLPVSLYCDSFINYLFRGMNFLIIWIYIYIFMGFMDDSLFDCFFKGSTGRVLDLLSFFFGFFWSFYHLDQLSMIYHLKNGR